MSSLLFVFGSGFATAITLVAVAKWLESCATEDRLAAGAADLRDALARLNVRVGAIERRIDDAEKASLDRSGLHEEVAAYATAPPDLWL